MTHALTYLPGPLPPPTHLLRDTTTQVGNTPGVTKSVQEVHLDKQVTLLDSPGVVFADAGAEGAAAAALRNAVKAEQLPDPAAPVRTLSGSASGDAGRELTAAAAVAQLMGPPLSDPARLPSLFHPPPAARPHAPRYLPAQVAEIVRRCPAKQLMALYKVAAFEGPDQFLALVAAARGKLRRGGAVNTTAAARIVLQDWNDGRIPYFTLPPTRDSEVPGSAQLVSAWGADFDVDQSAALAGLAPMEGGSGPGGAAGERLGWAGCGCYCCRCRCGCYAWRC